MTSLLERYGLQSLTSWASDAIIRGLSPEEIELQLRDRAEFKSRFPAIEAREKAGLPPLSADEYLSFENTISQMSRVFGMTITKSQTDTMLSNNVSAVEAQDRLTLAARAVFEEPAETRVALDRLYGITTGDLMNYWLDPKKTLPILQRRFAAADIAGSAQAAGYLQLSAIQAERLYEGGVTEDTARGAFGELVRAEELFESVDQTEQDIGLDQQLELLTGNQELAQQVERRGERRAARFQEGGTFATGRTGLAGLGSANQR
jgi:hypothetical protein